MTTDDLTTRTSPTDSEDLEMMKAWAESKRLTKTMSQVLLGSRKKGDVVSMLQWAEAKKRKVMETRNQLQLKRERSMNKRLDIDGGIDDLVSTRSVDDFLADARDTPNKLQNRRPSDPIDHTIGILDEFTARNILKNVFFEMTQGQADETSEQPFPSKFASLCTSRLVALNLPVKFIVQVVSVAAANKCATHMNSGCLWNPLTDNTITMAFDLPEQHIVATVYGFAL